MEKLLQAIICELNEELNIQMQQPDLDTTLVKLLQIIMIEQILYLFTVILVKFTQRINTICGNIIDKMV